MGEKIRAHTGSSEIDDAMIVAVLTNSGCFRIHQHQGIYRWGALGNI